METFNVETPIASTGPTTTAAAAAMPMPTANDVIIDLPNNVPTAELVDVSNMPTTANTELIMDNTERYLPVGQPFALSHLPEAPAIVKSLFNDIKQSCGHVPEHLMTLGLAFVCTVIVMMIIHLLLGSSDDKSSELLDGANVGGLETESHTGFPEQPPHSIALVKTHGVEKKKSMKTNSKLKVESSA